VRFSALAENSFTNDTADDALVRDRIRVVIKAGEIHSFNTGDAPLVQRDVHLSPRFIQENL